MEQSKALGLIVFAHGSSVAEANEAVRRAAGETARRCRIPLWETAFLELAQPDLTMAVQSLSARGAGRIIVTPFFLTMGIHLQRDLPRILDEISQAHPGIDLVCSPPLDGHPALIDILAERAHQAISS